MPFFFIKRFNIAILIYNYSEHKVKGYKVTTYMLCFGLRGSTMHNSYHKVPECLKGVVSIISRKSICCSIFPTNIVTVEELIIKDTA